MDQLCADGPSLTSPDQRSDVRWRPWSWSRNPEAPSQLQTCCACDLQSKSSSSLEASELLLEQPVKAEISHKHLHFHYYGNSCYSQISTQNTHTPTHMRTHTHTHTVCSAYRSRCCFRAVSCLFSEKEEVAAACDTTSRWSLPCCSDGFSHEVQRRR